MKTHPPLRIPLAAPLLIVCIFGCGTDGALEQTQIGDECADGAYCGPELGDGPFAVGASFELSARVTSPGSSTPVVDLIAVDPTVIEASAGQITGVGPGMSAVLITNDEGVVLDFIHVFVEEPDHLQIIRLADTSGADIDGPIELLVGDELALTSIPSISHQAMVGNAPSTWSATGAAVSILADGDPVRRRVVAREIGDTTITVDSMGLSRTFTIQVLP